MKETFHCCVTKADERYAVTFGGEYWHVLDSKESHPTLAKFHKSCPDAESMAKSLANWLNSGPEAVRKPYWEEGQRLRHKHGGQEGTLVFHNGHPAVRRDGDSYASGLITSEWEPV